MHAALDSATFTFDYELIEGIFLERPNRFISVLEIPGELGEPQTVRAHVADPGRLKELLIPGVKVLVRDFGENSGRKLRYSLELVYATSGQLVSVNTQLPNRIAAKLLSEGRLPGFEAFHILKREVTYGKSRIDFLLSRPEGTACLLEVKSCTLVEELAEIDEATGQPTRLALFPDAPSERGSRHIEELIAALKEGFESRVLILIQRGDADAFATNRKTDPRFTAAFAEALAAGVQITALCFEMTATGCRFIKEVALAHDTRP